MSAVQSRPGPPQRIKVLTRSRFFCGQERDETKTRGTLINIIYDNRFLVKKTKSYENSGFKEVIPYPTSKGMYLVDSEDQDEIKEMVLTISNELMK